MSDEGKISRKKYAALKNALLELSLTPDDGLREAELNVIEKAEDFMAPSFTKAEQQARANALKLYLGS